MALPIEAPKKEIYRGDYTDLVAFQQQNADGTPKDLSTGYTWLCEWRLTPDDATALTLTVDHSNAAQGWLYISATAQVTAQMTGSGIWDLQQTGPDGKPYTKVFQKTKLKDDVSRA